MANHEDGGIVTQQGTSELARIHAACFDTPAPWSEASLIKTLNRTGAILVEGPGGFLVGCVLGGEAEVLTLAVTPDQRGQGMGQELLETFLLRAQDAGAMRVFLEVRAENTAALALYDKLGFRKVGFRPKYYKRPDGGRDDAFILQKPLDHPTPA